MVLVLRVTTIIHDNDNGYVWVVGYDNDGDKYLFDFFYWGDGGIKIWFVGYDNDTLAMTMTMIPLQ